MRNVNTPLLKQLYPHILMKVDAVWGYKQCRTFLMTLINDSRDGNRNGFPPAVAKEIMALLVAHDNAFPHYDDSDHIIPFTGNRPTKVYQPVQHDWSFIGTVAKIILLVLVIASIYRFVKHAGMV